MSVGSIGGGNLAGREATNDTVVRSHRFGTGIRANDLRRALLAFWAADRRGG